MTPFGKRFADDRQAAIGFAVAAPTHLEAREFDPARDVDVDRDHHRRPTLRLHRLAVDDQAAVADLDRVAGKADHALDIIVALARRGDDDDVAALGHLAEQPPLPVREDVEAGDTHDQP